ncbi:hypothetical protein L6452_09304 [Arctium lappa]|uniref:Uncharacterized protein n=1 Tax=Arctium lappa TaxID=4217 RepID=A0ACB9DKP6_ARCLA|nr:hypothetical protein L6452_09304 [Arctium lappa]
MNLDPDLFEDQQGQSQVMEFMDIDQVVEVPDTPERFIAACNNDGNCIGNRSDGSSSCRVIDKEYINEKLRNEPREKGKSVTVRGGRRLFVRSENYSNSSGSTLGNSSSCKNILPTVDNANHEKEKALPNPDVQRSTCQEDSFVDLTEQTRRAHVFGKATSTGASGTASAHPSRKYRFPTYGFPAVDAFDTASKSSGLNNTIKFAPRSDRGKGVEVGAQHKAESNSSSLASISPRGTRQKRLVRNGCISPHNIAKSKQVAEKHDAGRVAKDLLVDVGTIASDGPPSSVNVKDLVSEAKNSRRFKGKGVSLHPSFEESDARNAHLSQRSSVIFKEASDASKDLNVDTSTCFKESDGWITTHNTVRKVDHPLVDGDPRISRGKAASRSAIGQQKNGMVQKDHRNGSISSNINNHFEDLEIDSTQHVPAPPETMSRRTHKLGQFKDRAQFTKRQREGVALSNTSERAVPRPDDSEIATLRLSEEPSTSRSTMNKNRRGAGALDPVVALDESSPEVGNRRSNTHRSSTEDPSFRALQVEADEMLARELQEQLYNEELAPAFGIDEMDSHHALAMAMQQGDSSNAIHAGARPAYRPTSIGSSTSNLFQHPRSNPSRNPSILRGVNAQAPTSARLARLRGRFPGRPRTLSSTPRNSIFPSNMDVDMRMQILEALEAFNDMELPNDFLQIGREFNENDYEMLLALDDNNHQHGGATHAQINNLPESTVQAENLQECAICLETPTIGETIRHLPCLHGFHKDCIDQWLRRKTSCPVCKSSVT